MPTREKSSMAKRSFIDFEPSILHIFYHKLLKFLPTHLKRHKRKQWQPDNFSLTTLCKFNFNGHGHLTFLSWILIYL